MNDESQQTWKTQDAVELYDIERWGKGYFSVSDGGTLQVHPGRDPNRSIDMKELIDRMQVRGIDLPILLRFNGILRDRMQEIAAAFARAIDEHDYKGSYSCVYPIKVNQQRNVVEKVVEYGRELGFGLEAGSKPELLAVVAMTDADTPIICNGFKDDEFIEMAMLAQKIGRRVIPVVEKYTELELILKYAEKVGVRPQIGMRVKLAARGSGRWQASGGFRSKFGLTVGEVLRGVKELESRGMADCFKLLHFHLGSQITNIRHIKSALTEAGRIYCDLVKRCPDLDCVDVGGGLGVDYDGSQTDLDSSVNYTLQEYANDVIFHLFTVCEDAGVPHPNVISESGRAIAAYHAVLVFGILGVSGQSNNGEAFPDSFPDEYEQPLRTLLETYQRISSTNILESFHDAQQALDNAMNLFAAGYLPLDQRGIAESLYWAICRRLRKLSTNLEFVPDELKRLDRMLSDTFFCNFSLFQSIPDSWAIKQLFPILPIHRLDERPSQHGVLGDITCDSDGKIDEFIALRESKPSLRLHEFDGSPYYLGAFLVGAYQEILGDLHNLFGDTHAVHVEIGPSDEIVIEDLVKGDTVHEVLHYVSFNYDSLVSRLQNAVESAVQRGLLGHAEAGRFVKFYEAALHGYTYLEEPQE